MFKHFVFGVLVCSLLFACGSKKSVTTEEKQQTDSYINPKTEVALAGSVNFEDEESLSIYTAILKNVIGGKAGAYIGFEMDKLANYFDDNLQPSEILRAGEGVILEFNSTSDFMFKTGNTSLNPKSQQIANIIAKAMANNSKVNLIIETHTDDSGDEDINMKLSEDRVQSIKSYLTNQGIQSSRIKTKSYGEVQPKVKNDTLENRQLNRRVEFGFYASEKLKEEAKEATQ